MAQLNSGGKLEVWNVTEGWIPLHDAYFMEGTEYRLRFVGDNPDIRIQDIPIPFYREKEYFVCDWTTPFQSGIVTVLINKVRFETYIYPDQRKITEEKYYLMLKEIMDEAGVCFQYSGLELHVDSFGRSRGISWPQWMYIQRNFYQLSQIFTTIAEQPIRQLVNRKIMMNRESVQYGANETLRWLDKKGYGYDIPKNVQSTKIYETKNIYENQVVKQQLIDLQRLLQKYERAGIDHVLSKAKKMKRIIRRWLNSPFLMGVSVTNSKFTITQRFRKHPTYRLWYQWYEQLYSHKQEGIGFSYPIPLKDTFQLYELWCYIKILEVLRKHGYIKDVSDVFKTTQNEIFLDLAENKESRIALSEGMSLYYQRVYQYNSKLFYTYTQRMIPDIVIEGKYGLIVFDPKYRVAQNLGTALGEMHKYRDGIIHKSTGERAVQAVFILTPTKIEEVDGLRYFNDEFHNKYNMGAIHLMPGSNTDHLEKKILACMEGLKGTEGK